MYNMPYELDSPEELLRLTELADYYCALRIVSCTLDAALYQSHWVRSNLVDWASPLLPAAAKLRNKTLFSDCLTLCLGPWDHPAWFYLNDQKFKD
jgi:hypothetical protein